MAKLSLIPYTVKNVSSIENATIPEGVSLIQAPQIWQEARYGQDRIIAVIDTGCQTDHPDLINQIIHGRNFTQDYNAQPDQYEDNNGHGTHVAGTIAAAPSGEHGITGVAPKAKLLILKVLSENGSGDYQWITDAINYAIDWTGPNNEKTCAISMSLGGPENNQALHDAIKRAIDHNIPVICAAGNDGDGRTDTNEYAYPGAYPEVIQVGAINNNRQLADFSNTNDEIDLVAPGVDILSTYLSSQYAQLSGTSMATPHIAGAIALLKNISEQQFNRRLTEAELYAQLVKRTIPLGYEKSAEGNGLLALDILNQYAQIFQTHLGNQHT